MHTIGKLISTTRVVSILFCARMFGEHIENGWDTEVDYCLYQWRGKRWKIPLSPIYPNA